MDSVQQRGRPFVTPGEQVYEGQVIGVHQRAGDLKVRASWARHGWGWHGGAERGAVRRSVGAHPRLSAPPLASHTHSRTRAPAPQPAPPPPHTHTRAQVNPCKKKQLTNMRAAGKDATLVLTEPVAVTLDFALEYVADDEVGFLSSLLAVPLARSPACLPACLSPCPPACLPACHLARLPACLPPCRDPGHLPPPTHTRSWSR